MLISSQIELNEKKKGGRQTSLNSQFAVILHSEKVAVGFLVLIAVPLGVMAVDFNQTFKFAAVLLKKPCGFNCAAPC